jgi:hypothetical protein
MATRFILEGLVDFSLYDLAQRMAQRLHVPLCYYPLIKQQEKFMQLVQESIGKQPTSLLLQYEYHALQYHEHAISENWHLLTHAVFCGSNERDLILASVQLNELEYKIYKQWKTFIPNGLTSDFHHDLVILFYQTTAKKTSELQKIHEAYQAFGHRYDASPILFVNCDAFNPLENVENFDRLCYYLQPNMMTQPRYYI